MQFMCQMSSQNTYYLHLQFFFTNLRTGLHVDNLCINLICDFIYTLNTYHGYTGIVTTYDFHCLDVALR